MPKSRPRSPASASSSIKCNYGCWTLRHAKVRQHLHRQLTPVRQAHPKEDARTLGGRSLR
jgi:hypothetical protein